MNRGGNYFYVIIAIVFIFHSCLNNPKPFLGSENPIFKTDPVLKAMTEEISKNPANAKLFLDRGLALRKMKFDTLAIADFKKAISLDSNNSVYYGLIGDILFENKDITGSVQWIQKALLKNPKDKKARLKVAKLLLYIQKYNEGLAQIDIVLRSDPYNAEGYFLKGMIQKELKDTAKAISSFLTSMQVAPDYRDAVIELGMIYSNKKDSIALKYLDNAYRIDSSDIFPIFARGVYYQENNDFVHAKEEYRKCILKDRHYVNAYFNLGSIYLQQDSTAKAKRQFEMVNMVDPRNPTAYYNKAVCLEAMDSVKEAIAEYRHALILDPTYEHPMEALKRLKVKNINLPKQPN